MNPPIYYKPASKVRRISAGSINFLAVGILAAVSKLVTGSGILSHEESVGERLVLLGLFTLFWFVSVMMRSPGSALCLLECRSSTFEPLSFRERALWALPFLFFGAVAIGPFPAGHVFEILQAAVFLISVIALGFDGIVLVASGRSLRDRMVGVTVLQLSLPDHLKPRIFGQRVV